VADAPQGDLPTDGSPAAATPNGQRDLRRPRGPYHWPVRAAPLGTGKMGTAVGPRIDGAGFELTIWNRTPETHPS